MAAKWPKRFASPEKARFELRFCRPPSQLCRAIHNLNDSKKWVNETGGWASGLPAYLPAASYKKAILIYIGQNDWDHPNG